MHPYDAVLRSNPEYVEAMHRQYLEDPTSLPPSWAAFFAGYDLGRTEADAGRVEAQRAEARPSEDAPAEPTTEAPAPRAPGPPAFLTATGDLPEGAEHHAIEAGLRIYDLVHTYRTYGHLIADIDPLGRSEREHPLLALDQFGFSEADLDQVVRCENFQGTNEAPVREYLERLRDTYCRSIGVEYMDVTDKDERDWLQERMEPVRNRPEVQPARRIALLRELVSADTFEETLGRFYPGVKRFSLEGGTTLVTLLDALVDDAAERGVEQVVMGMAHRGRINVLAHVLGKPLEYILAEFEGKPLPKEVQGYGDVKYHLGYSREHVTSTGRAVYMSLEFNPSHLEAIDPVVEGIVRARQNHAGDTARSTVLAVLVHGEAAFTGQGVVTETFTLGGLAAYHTGGTVHVIVNNQVGFTTDPEEGRSTRYASDIAKVVRAPVFHVNADDPEAVLHVAQLALRFRQRFRKDVVVDLICYRRHGHNELDDPSFTQPVMSRLVREHASNSRVYAARLVDEGVVTAEDLAAMVAEVRERMEKAREKAQGLAQQYLDKLGGIWEGLKPAGPDWSARTAVPRDTLEKIARALTQVPEDFNWHPRLKKIMAQRVERVLKDEPLDWGTAEALAVGSLLLEGTKVRLSGQDSARGTFGHRHAVYRDAQTGAAHVPLNHVAPGQNVFQVVNSPLSESAVLGFEYGYSTADPWTLVIWEAQFGDFANGAQVVIDQLIASGERKWGRMSGIVLLLPHGYEGQGPEHSSARLERFLELCAEGNMQVVNLTTPAQIFHALRAQVRRDFRKPLVVMAPKSLLRHSRAVSRIDDLTDGWFRPVIDDPSVRERGKVRKLLLCSGKVAYTLVEARQERGIADVPIVRLEQLYPFPHDELAQVVAGLPALERVVWVQEEPRNMGAWRHLQHRFRAVVPRAASLEYCGRDSRAVPATGSYEVHEREERELVELALSDDPARRIVRRDPTAPVKVAPS
jgi:2-oxoglutarate dehydrogenase E1 component